MSKFRYSLFIFRRDLRLEDNTALIAALEQSERVIPCFIFTPEQITHNPYKSDHAIRFMIESLEDLANQLQKRGGHLYLFYGQPAEILQTSIRKLGIEALFVNRDYTPYSKARDTQLEKICQSHHIPFYSFDDALLHPPEEVLKKEGKPYLIFTPYFRQAIKKKVLAPVPNSATNYFQGSIPFAKGPSLLPQIFPRQSIQNSLRGGRTEGLKLLKKIDLLANYEERHESLVEGVSSHLSPYLKFTLLSPREVYAAICSKWNSQHDLIRSLYWRDFFTHIAFFFPHVFKKAFHSKFDKLEWSTDEKAFQKWCEGQTGFPLVDAGMREMNETGFMPNRLRMITASFLIKDLHIDWRWGERYFAQTLVDYDPAVNNGNWQWVASTGCDAQPYFRIFNPWSQQKKFDPSCFYIKKWVPELRLLPPLTIHRWFDPASHADCPSYPPPLLNHEAEAKKAIQLYRIK